MRRTGESGNKRSDRPSGMRPLRRKPKQLDSDPSVFVPSSGGRDGVVFTRLRNSARSGTATNPGSGAPAMTEEPAQLLEAADAVGTDSIDAETLRRARQIATRLAIRRPRLDTVPHRGVGELASTRYRGGSDDIDLDATLDSLIEHPMPEDEDIVVRERMDTRRSVVLAVDVSGSMRGERIRTAAAAVGALVGALAHDDLAVLAFWSDAVLLAPLGRPVSAAQILEMLMRIPARGLTNIAFPLQLAGQQLATVPARNARALLLSDCVHNAGPDPRLEAARLPRLDVLLDTSGEHDIDMARDLARIGRGRHARVDQFRAVAPALADIFTR